jgi:hypothetical protein
LILPALRRSLRSDRVVALGTIGTVLTLLAFATVRNPVVAAFDGRGPRCPATGSCVPHR